MRGGVIGDQPKIRLEVTFDALQFGGGEPLDAVMILPRGFHIPAPWLACCLTLERATARVSR